MQRLLYEYQEKWHQCVQSLKQRVVRGLSMMTYPIEVFTEVTGWLISYFIGGLIGKLIYPFVALGFWLQPKSGQGESFKFLNYLTLPFAMFGEAMASIAQRIANLRLFRYLLLPFEWSASLFANIFAGIVNARIFAALGYGLEVITQAAVSFGGKCMQLAFGNRVARVITPHWVLHRPSGEPRDFAYPFRSVAHFVTAWVHTRNYRAMLGGIPAALLIIGAGGLVIRLSLLNAQGVAANYQRLAQESLKENDLVTLELCNRKLERLGITTERSEFRAAAALEEDGKHDEAVARMAALADPEQGGFAPAHLWMAAQFVTNKIQMPRRKQLELASTHLKWFGKSGQSDSRADILWAEIHSEFGNQSSAYERLEKLVDSYPEFSLDMFVSSIEAGKIDAAREDAMRLKSYLATKDENELTVEQAFRLAQAHDVLADRSSARRVASMALQKWPEEMRLRVLVGKLAIGEYDRISNIESAKVSQRMKFLQEAMKSGAVDAELSVRLADLYTKRSTSPAAASTVKALLLAPESPAFVFFQFGTQAALEGDTTTARKFLKRTLRINPDDANALNNIAWLMANSQPKDLRTAIKAANKALLYEPRNFHFRETRGQIHLAREEWQMAIQDLEFALPYLGTEKAKTVRQSLSAAYEALGKTRPGY